MIQRSKTRSRTAALRDSYCGKTIGREKAVKLTWEEGTYFFCSESCRRAFEHDPPGDAGFR